MHRRLEPSPAPAVDDPRFARTREQGAIQEGIERLDGFRRGLAVQIQNTSNVLCATCYVITCNVITCNVITCCGRAASWLRRLQVRGGDDDGTPLQLDEEPPAVAHFAHDSCAESRDVHAIARSEGCHHYAA
jgi:hypothetical protein